MSEPKYSVHGNLENRTVLQLIERDDHSSLCVDRIDIVELINSFKRSGVDINCESSMQYIQICTEEGPSKPLKLKLFPDFLGRYSMKRENIPIGVVVQYDLEVTSFFGITLEDFVRESSPSLHTKEKGVCCTLHLKTYHKGTNFSVARKYFDKISSVIEVLENKFILTSDTTPIK